MRLAASWSRIDALSAVQLPARHCAPRAAKANDGNLHYLPLQ